MALKLEAEYKLTLSGGGEVEGKLVDLGGMDHVIELTWSPSTQYLTPADGVRIRAAQDCLRLLATHYRHLTDIENTIS